MRLERLTYNKIKIFLTYDDLNERGITKEEMWQDIPKVHQLFREMIMEADDELGFKVDGPIAVEVFALPAQGMVVIVTKGSNEYELDDEEYDDDYIEMQVTLDESDEVFYEFQTFEDIISLAKRLFDLEIYKGTLYSFDGRFYLKFDESEYESFELDSLIALLAEFGNPSTITSYRVIEYGKTLMESNAIEQLHHYFYGK
ncbi:genetic competence negative regulator [Pseudalkalibacillus caeni]|uniref:Adapter protein MecA n=1 Tax=Exobacillus caeni TaxID=2574798 RepID=A0A5R9F759_9BACL|nr:genetic competence negative regulator [Pseudalkalibacillus caeni]TLS35615.1 genetic competence negative regulator [Pseudalkalibacillus caeni]